MWEVEETTFSGLRLTLNSIDARGGTVFQILEGGPRKEFCHVVWFKHADGKSLNGDSPAQRERRSATRPMR